MELASGSAESGHGANGRILAAFPEVRFSRYGQA
jgi:hypothetical protein